MQRLRYWQPPRPLCGCVRFATRPMIIGRPPKIFGDALLHLLLEAVHRHRRQELAVGQLRQALAAAADAGEALDVVVPRRDVLVADRPVDGDAVARVGLEVEVAPAVRLPAPQQRPAADVIAAHPVEALDLGVRDSRRR